jgi:hypothetical protein
MATFPNRLADRAAKTIAETARLVRNAHQRLNTMGSQVSQVSSQVAALTPGAWEFLALQNGWTNVSGYIPAQVRILQGGMAQVIGHIQGGTTGNGTTIATLSTGYYNTVHAHAFTVNAVTGASASAQSGAVSNGAVSTAVLPAIPATDRSFTVTGISGSTGTLDLGPSSGQQIGNLNLNSQALNSTTTSTAVNMNTPTLTLSTSGALTIQNVDPNVTQLSFTQVLPLVTS